MKKLLVLFLALASLSVYSQEFKTSKGLKFDLSGFVRNDFIFDSRKNVTAADVLVQDKFENNPFLKKLSEFDGVAPEIQNIVKHGEGEQIGLF